MRSRLVALALASLVAASVVHAPTAATAGPRRVRIEAAEGGTLLVHGTYPRVASRCVAHSQPLLHARYSGAIEVGVDGDGSLFVIGELGFEEYLQGIAEVPRTWPIEALKAQVVAARSYALARMRFADATGSRLGYDLCATDACQVYRGTGISEGPWGERWKRAVEATRGEVLVHEGRPAETVYFSTSNGRTYGNERVFGGAPVPYLRPVVERDDGASPVSRWSVRMPLRDLTRFLRDAGLWSGSAIREVRQRGTRVVLTGAGRRRALARAELRSALNASAPCLDPATYPTGDLPQTVPSIWFRAGSDGGELRIRGRGWGHGVGMVQWGAYGKAEDGMSYREILGAYYGGLTPVAFDTPSTIRVGIATGLETVTIVADGPVRVRGRDLGDGPWRFTGGRRLKVRPASEPGPVLSVSGFQAPRRARAGRTIRAALVADRPVAVRLVLRGPGVAIPLGPAHPSVAGRIEVEARVPPDVVDGDYRVVAEVTDGIDRVSRAAQIGVVGGVAAPAPTSSPSPAEAEEPPREVGPTPRAVEGSPGDGPGAPWLPAAVALGIGLLVGAGIVLRRRAGSR